VFAAVYLDAGMARAREVILAQLSAAIDQVVAGADTNRDEKTLLQERVQARRSLTPTYEVVGTEGPDHERVWYVEVRAGDDLRARGQGRSKKAAEQDAAGHALRLLEEVAAAPTAPVNGGGDG